MIQAGKSIWRRVSYWGKDGVHTKNQQRTLVLTNRISLLIAGFTLILCLLSVLSFGWIYSSQLALLFSLLFLLPMVLNRLGYLALAPMFLSMIISVASLIVSVVDKFDYFQLEEFQYFQFRLTILTASLFPFILFKLSETRFWIPALLFNFLCVIFYDPVHVWFGVGYYAMGFTAPNYHFLTYMTTATFFVLAITTFFLKRSFEKSEAANESLIAELRATSAELMEANVVIQQQQLRLSEENITLSQEVLAKNQQLTATNAELISHNNDLQEFSYTISHNLKGPLASITGLLGLVNEAELGPSNTPLMHHFRGSVQSLETTIKDLSNIIDTRNRITRLRQPIFFSEVVEQIKTQLTHDIEETKAEITCAFEDAPDLFSVKAMVHSILYNLVSNAIKYRHADRPCKVLIRSSREAGQTRIEVSDNGLGIDLNRHGQKLFSLYQRFHTHLEGKGLGLFLVKLQTEALGGKIKVKSEPDSGTTFVLTFKESETIQEQILLNTPVVKVYYDALIDALCTLWKGPHPNPQFEEVLVHSLEFIKTYRTPNWISDLRNVPYRNEDELNRIRERYSHEYTKAGIERIAVVVNPAYYSEPDYILKKEALVKAYPLHFYFAETFEEAYEWIKAAHVARLSLKNSDLPFQ